LSEGGDRLCGGFAAADGVFLLVNAVLKGMISRSWIADSGFRDSYAEPLTGPDSMVVGIK